MGRGGCEKRMGLGGGERGFLYLAGIAEQEGGHRPDAGARAAHAGEADDVHHLRAEGRQGGVRPEWAGSGDWRFWDNVRHPRRREGVKKSLGLNAPPVLKIQGES